MKHVERLLQTTILDPSSAEGILFFGLIFAILTAVALIIIRVVVRRIRLRREGRLDAVALSYVSRLLQAFAVIVGCILYAHTIPELRALGTALLAGASVASVVIGIAAQSSLGNMIAGLLILVYRPFRAGDRIQIQTPLGPETGEVEDLTLGYTVLATLDNRRVVVPNIQLISQVFINLSMTDPRLIIEVPLTIGYGADIDRAKAVLLDLAGGIQGIDETLSCRVSALGDSGVTLLVRFWCRDQQTGRVATAELLEAAKKAFDREAIEIPYPYRSVVIRNPPASGS